MRHRMTKPRNHKDWASQEEVPYGAPIAGSYIELEPESTGLGFIVFEEGDLEIPVHPNSSVKMPAAPLTPTQEEKLAVLLIAGRPNDNRYAACAYIPGVGLIFEYIAIIHKDKPKRRKRMPFT
jgi:hypothetical protein